MLTIDKVYKASHILKEVIRETDMILAPNIRQGTNIYLKTENLQERVPLKSEAPISR